MNAYEFISGSPFVGFFIAYMIIHASAWVVFRVANRFFRMMNIRKHGWPPPHCDADGDATKQTLA